MRILGIQWLGIICSIVYLSILSRENWSDNLWPPSNCQQRESLIKSIIGYSCNELYPEWDFQLGQNFNYYYCVEQFSSISLDLLQLGLHGGSHSWKRFICLKFVYSSSDDLLLKVVRVFTSRYQDQCLKLCIP